MRNRLSDDTVEKMYGMFEEGIPVKKIIGRLGVSYGTVYNHRRVWNGEFDSINDYYDNLARKRGYSDQNEKKRHLKELKNGGVKIKRVRPKNSLGREKHEPEYNNKWAKKKGFESFYKYEVDRGKKRSENVWYQASANLIKDNLKKKGITQVDLSRLVGIDRTYMTRICQARRLPPIKRLGLFASALGISEEKLEYIVQSANS